MSQELITTADLAERLGVHRSTIHRHIAEAGIEPEIVAGRTRLFDRARVEALFARGGHR